MRVLSAVNQDEGESICAGAEAVGHSVVRLGDSPAADLTAALRRDSFDVLIVSAHPHALTADVVDACDARGIFLVAIVENRVSYENARLCGVGDYVGPWQTWTEIEQLLITDSRRYQVKNSQEEGSQTTDSLRPPVVPRIFSPVSRSREPRESSLVASERDEVSKIPRVEPMAAATENPAMSFPRVVAVWGPTGAPGRTTLALNIATLMTQRGLRVVLIDADTFGGAVAIRLGIFDEAPGIARACRLAGAQELSGAELVDVSHELLVKGRPMHVVTGILGSSRWPEISRDRLQRVIECAREVFDVVVLDIGFSLESDEEISSDLLAPRRNAATHAALRAATDVVAVAGSDSVGLARFIRLWSDVSESNPDARFTVCVNRVVWQRDGSTAAESITSAFSRFAGIRDVILIPESSTLMTRADSRGEPACLVDPGSAFTRSLTEIVSRLVGTSSARPSNGIATHITTGMRDKLRSVRLLG